MTNVEFWTEVCSIVKLTMDMKDNMSEHLNIEDDEYVEALYHAERDTLEKVFERANNELIVAVNQVGNTQQVGNTREELLDVIASYGSMIDKDDWRYPLSVLNDIRSSIRHVLEVNNK